MTAERILAAARDGDAAAVRELLDAGAELEAWTNWGATPLEWAGVVGSRRAGDVLLAHGARLTLATAAGLGLNDELPRLARQDGAVSAAFVLACRNGHTDAARFLLDRGADVDARGFFGATGLHWAAHSGHADTVRFLLDQGADTTLHDTQFDPDALDWAREGGHEPVVVLLVAH
jgi:ankyrin repeat protein